ncbi:MAG: hypothetical protein O3A10_05055 [Chloroflexi bacterium]|nr:hypothetical protein [Chloroflexota bacterium]MDA1145492.1 hypothetical protein [Chloroflexota bacterium]
MALSIPCAACGYRMQGNLVGVTFRPFVVDGQGRLFPVPDGLDQYLLCRTCARYFEHGFGELVGRAMARQADTAEHGALS